MSKNLPGIVAIVFDIPKYIFSFIIHFNSYRLNFYHIRCYKTLLLLHLR